jgi:exopolysaccharide production protein ExoQ
MATAIRSMMIPPTRSVSALIVSWVLMLPLLVFASQWGFSFEHGAINTAVGSLTQGADDSLSMKLQSALVYFTCACVMMRFARAIWADFYKDMLISGLPILAFLSIAWSQFAAVTLVHAVLLAANMAFAFYLLERFKTNDLLKVLMMAGTLAVIGGLFLIVLFPQYGVQSRNSVTSGAWQGIFPQKNIGGFVMTNLLLPAFFVQFKSHHARGFRILYIGVVLAMIAMSRSAGAWVICAACIVFVLAMRSLVRMPHKQVAAIVFLFVGLVAIAGVCVYRNFDLLMYSIGKDPTLTGRTTIWSSLVASVMKRPMLGYGYTAFWGGMQGESANTAILMHWPGMGYAENGVLELWLELGLAGVVLYLLVFLRAIKDAAHCFMRRPSPAVMWYICSLFFVTVSNIEAGKLLSTSDLGFILSLVSFSGLRREAQCSRLTTRYQHQGEGLGPSGARGITTFVKEPSRSGSALAASRTQRDTILSS